MLLTAWRFHRRHWIQLILSIAGIALGVAVFVGVDVANTSANAAFESSASFVRGTTTHRLLPVDGRLDERIFAQRFASTGISAAPIVEVSARTAQNAARVTLLGVDVIEEAAFGDATRPGLLAGFATDVLLSVPATAVVAADVILDPDQDQDRVAIVTESGAGSLQIVGTLPTDSGATGMILTDISTAQEVAGMLGSLSRIDLILTADEARELQNDLPPGTALVIAGSENQAFDQLSNAFRINILALGLLALAVGMFLVYSSANFSLQTRARDFATLRTIGAERRELGAGIVYEFLVLGIAASSIGVALGHGLARLLVELMLTTVSDFAFRGDVAVGDVSLWLYGKGLLIGIAATIAAAIGPMRRAVRRDLAAALRTDTVARSFDRRNALLISAALLCLGVVLLSLPAGLVVAFAGLFAVLAAAATGTPPVVAWLVSLLTRLPERLRSFVSLHAARNVLAHQSRTAVATAALTLAVSCVIGVGVMIDSFRSSLQSWLDRTLTSDIYVNLSGDDAAAESLIEFLQTDPAVTGFSLTRVVDMPSPWGSVAIRGFRPGERGWGLQVMAGNAQEAARQLASGQAVAITEPFALRSGLGVGDELRLPHAGGELMADIVAVYRDYNTGGAGVLMALSLLERLRGESGIDGVGVEVGNGAPIGALESRIRARLAGSAARITTTAGIKSISLEIFDRTFAITEVLRILAGTVAFLGMLSALMAVQLSRRREFAILRALGFLPGELRRLIVTETTILGVCAGAFALPIGIALAALLVFVINVRSFGWTMAFEVVPSALAPGFLLAVGAALLAGIGAAVYDRRGSVSDALRHS